MKRTAVLLIWAIALLGFAGAFSLVQDELASGNICPQLEGIPACHIILGCFAAVLISHSGLLKDRFLLFYVGAGIAWIMAAVGASGEIFGWMECPKTESGIPMCYLSFGIFSSLLILKIIQVRLR